ncbi:VOC family protein [Pseudofulvibacter geojedonensis]|uniref:VOC family protein n=1 Tax=Pseudofulvibacter geojedonensis TaxID=1123758 RepID=A0ABW3I380_9FLAO
MNLNQITLPSLNLKKAVVFYQKLGFNLIVDALPRYARFECLNGESTFSLHLVDQLPNKTGISIYFEVDDLNKTVNQLIKKGIVFEQLPKEQSWLWKEAYLKDLDGNQLIIYSAGKNRKNPPWRIN